MYYSKRKATQFSRYYLIGCRASGKTTELYIILDRRHKMELKKMTRKNLNNHIITLEKLVKEEADDSKNKNIYTKWLKEAKAEATKRDDRKYRYLKYKGLL